MTRRARRRGKYLRNLRGIQLGTVAARF